MTRYLLCVLALSGCAGCDPPHAESLAEAASTSRRVKARDFAVPPDLTVLPDLVTLPDLTGSAPVLGAHMVFARDEACGTNPSVSNTSGSCGTGPFGTLTTTTGSIVLLLQMEWTVNAATPLTDSKGNTYTAADALHSYGCSACSGVFDTHLWRSVGTITGGAGHFWSFAQAGRDTGELSVPIIEIKSASTVQQVRYAYSAPGGGSPWTHNAGGSVTTTGPALLIAIWGGGANGLTHDATPGNSFVALDSYLNLGPSSAVQVAVATRSVAGAGTYSMDWTSTSDSDAAVYLIAVQ